MSAFANPALEKFVAKIGDELILAQVWIRRREHGYELRHVADRDGAPEKLRLLSLQELRPLAQFTATGSFRPLKSAPNLQSGWRAVIANDAELETALNHLYPGAIADWFAAQTEEPAPITNFREFTERQTGMYRITAMLTDEQAVQVIRAGCHKNFCLKRRLWTVDGLELDATADKSLIPCLEPCAVLLEFARKAMRIEQGEKIRMDVSADDAATVQAALKQPDATLREADFNAPANPRRIQLVLEKITPLLKPPREEEEDP